MHKPRRARPDPALDALLMRLVEVLAEDQADKDSAREADNDNASSSERRNARVQALPTAPGHNRSAGRKTRP
jgi:hypothetical protein